MSNKPNHNKRLISYIRGKEPPRHLENEVKGKVFHLQAAEALRAARS
jgi:hypothetical protein